MTKDQFDKINKSLIKWRDERGLDREEQKAFFLADVLGAASRYFRVDDDLERIDILCDVVIRCFNSFDMSHKFYPRRSSKKVESVFDDAVPLMIVSHCFYLGQSLGFDFYRCLREAVRARQRTYTIEYIRKKYPGSKYSICELEKDFIVFNERGETEAFLDKCYKADYSKYYIGDEI